MEEIEIVVSGSGAGFDFRSSVGTLRFNNEKNGVRIFLAGDEKGVFLTEPTVLHQLHRSARYITAKIVPGGDLVWSGLDTVQEALVVLREKCLHSWRALVQVGSAGDVAGSDLAGKVRIETTDGRKIVRTVPASQVEAYDNKLWIPMWLAVEKVKPASPGGSCRLPEALATALDRLQGDLARQVLLVEVAAAPFQETERIEAPRRAEREVQVRAEAQERAKAFGLAAQQAAAERESKERERRQARFDDPATQHHRNIVATAWGGTSRKRVKNSYEYEDVAVLTRGARTYVMWQQENDIEEVTFSTNGVVSISPHAQL